MPTVRRFFTIQTLIAMATTVPFFAAVVAHALGHTPAPVTPGEPPSALAFEQYLVDLGNVEPTQEVMARFGFINVGKVPVKIRKFTPSCGCLTPQLKKREYGPNEDGEFLLRIRTAGEALGPREFWLDVEYEDVKPREVRLTFRVSLPENQVLVRPRALVFYQFGKEATTREIVVTDNRKEQLELFGARCETDLPSLDVRDPEVDEDGNRKIRVAVTIPGNVPPGRHRDVVTLLTNDPVYRELKVPLIIEGSPTLPNMGSGKPRAVRK